MSALNPVGVNTTFASGTTSVQSDAIAMQSDSIRVVAVTEGVHVAIGTNPVATSQSYFVSSTDPEVISLGAVRSNGVAGITTGASTIIDFHEGTGSPFNVGDAVSLTVAGQSNFDFTHKIVTNINNTAATGGYYSTRITVDHDSASVTDTLASTNTGTLRKSIKVAVLTAANTGTVHTQQVQAS